jgi:hypothetical protein
MSCIDPMPRLGKAAFPNLGIKCSTQDMLMYYHRATWHTLMHQDHDAVATKSFCSNSALDKQL